jgi:hypothetical protein
MINGNANDTVANTFMKDFHIGGALRFNVVTEFYDGDYETLDTYITSDTWRFNVNGNKKGIDLSFEYRFYPTYGTHFIHHGYFGFNIFDSLYASLGVSQVPFGVNGFASHSWWFQGPYYVGLEDDYDIGVKLDYTQIPNTEISFAYYRESEPEGPEFGGDVSFGQAGPGRYSYDITSSNERLLSDTSISIRELNHFHLRTAYAFGNAVTLGVSGQIGQVYNKALNTSEISLAYAGHLNANVGNWNFIGEYIYYNYNVKDDLGNELNLVPLGAYGLTYHVATECFLYVAGVSYTFNINAGPLEYIRAYTDYTLFDKVHSGYHQSHHLVPGFMAKIGNIVAYFDLAIGKNHPWLTNDFGSGLDQGEADAHWNKRLNINIGYYY